MQNSDINRRFSDWLLNPRETLDFEVKGWVDLADAEHRDFEAVVSCGWNGLEPRSMQSSGRRRYFGNRYPASQGVFRASGKFSKATLTDLMPEAVQKLLAPLFESFAFLVVSEDIYRTEIQALLERR